jgi:hypothetical protein
MVILRSCLWPEGKTKESVRSVTRFFACSALLRVSALNTLTKQACFLKGPVAWIVGDRGRLAWVAHGMPTMHCLKQHKSTGNGVLSMSA